MAYDFTATVTIDHTKCGSSDTPDFPFCFTLALPWLATTAHGGLSKSNGLDVVFTADVGGLTVLDFERVAYDGWGFCEFWVRVPTLSASSDTVLFLQIGKAGDSDHANPHGVWGTYSLVTHFGDGSAIDLTDSTVNANNGTLTSPPGFPIVGTGIQGGGSINMQGGGTIDWGNPGNLSVGGPFTVEAWVSMLSWNGFNPVLWSKWDGSHGVYVFHVLGSPGGLSVSGDVAVDTYFGPGNAPAPYPTKHVVVTYDGTTAKIYLDGAVAGTTTGTVQNPAVSFIGGRINTGANAGTPYWQGGIDEVRFSQTARTPSYVLATFNNKQVAPGALGTFYTITSPYTSSPVVTTNCVGIDLVAVCAIANNNASPASPGGVWSWTDGSGTHTLNVPYPGSTPFSPQVLTASLTGGQVTAAIAFDPTLGTFAIDDAVTNHGLTLNSTSTHIDPYGGSVLQFYDVYLKLTYNDASVTVCRPTRTHVTNAGDFSEGEVVYPSGSAVVRAYHTSGIVTPQFLGLFDFRTSTSGFPPPPTGPLPWVVEARPRWPRRPEAGTVEAIGSDQAFVFADAVKAPYWARRRPYAGSVVVIVGQVAAPPLSPCLRGCVTVSLPAAAFSLHAPRACFVLSLPTAKVVKAC